MYSITHAAWAILTYTSSYKVFTVHLTFLRVGTGPQIVLLMAFILLVCVVMCVIHQTFNNQQMLKQLKLDNIVWTARSIVLWCFSFAQSTCTCTVSNWNWKLHPVYFVFLCRCHVVCTASFFEGGNNHKQTMSIVTNDEN